VGGCEFEICNGVLGVAFFFLGVRKAGVVGYMASRAIELVFYAASRFVHSLPLITISHIMLQYPNDSLPASHAPPQPPSSHSPPYLPSHTPGPGPAPLHSQHLIIIHHQHLFPSNKRVWNGSDKKGSDKKTHGVKKTGVKRKGSKPTFLTPFLHNITRPISVLMLGFLTRTAEEAGHCG
jgi:hypothetical protein